MSDLRQYHLARLASHAWPRCSYRLVRIHDGNADAPAVFYVLRAHERMGTLTVTAAHAHFAGEHTDELVFALEAVQAALVAVSEALEDSQ